MLAEAYNEAVEGQQMAGLGLEFESGRQFDTKLRNQTVKHAPASATDGANVLYIRYGPKRTTESIDSRQQASSLGQKDTILKKVRTLLTESGGDTRVVLYDSERKKTRLLEDRFSVGLTPELIAALEEVVGLGNVKIGRMPST